MVRVSNDPGGRRMAYQALLAERSRLQKAAALLRLRQLVHGTGRIVLLFNLVKIKISRRS